MGDSSSGTKVVTTHAMCDSFGGSGSSSIVVTTHASGVVVAVAVCGGSGGGYIECTLMTTWTAVSRHKPPSTSPAAKRRPES